MVQIHVEYPWYRYRQVTKQLQREVGIINHKKSARIIREKGLICLPHKRKCISTTDSNHNLMVFSNLIQNLTVDGINKVWMADITYIHLLVFFVYLEVLLCVDFRKAIDYVISRNLYTQLALLALRMAITQRKLVLDLIHYFDFCMQKSYNFRWFGTSIRLSLSYINQMKKQT